MIKSKLLIFTSIILSSIIAFFIGFFISIKIAIIFIGILLVIFFHRAIKYRYLFMIYIVLLCFLPESARRFYPSFISIPDIFLIFIVLYWVMLRSSGRKPLFIYTPMNAACGLFILSGVLSILVGINYGAQVNAAIFDFMARVSYAIVFFIGASSLRKIKEQKYITEVIFFTGTIVAFLSILQAFYGLRFIDLYYKILNFTGYTVYSDDFIIKHIWWSPNMPAKSFLPYYGPNSLAGFLLIVFILGLIPFLKKDGLIRPRIRFVFLGLVYAGLIMTFSWAIYLILILTVVILLAFSKKAFGISSLMRLFLVILIIVTLLLPAVIVRSYRLLSSKTSLTEFFASEYKGLSLEDKLDKLASLNRFERIKTSNIQSRLMELRRSLRQFINYPLLGTGFSVGFSIEEKPEPYKHYVGVSNMYLEILNRMGILGLIIFLICICIYVKNITLVLLRPWSHKYILAGPAIAVLMIILYGMLDHTFLTTPALACMFWLFIGMGFAGKSEQKEHS